ncbi:hypothetical protein PZ897_06540 [Hoeflea sp. YIM 152468]|uniref:hypothetical protein n=1 Tax=Hoeflea sp. YIM 152468 TaxID=3031759 RepID=UPI0023DCAD36|nr:hypothetical protein [Hoeflea sp. YIM 152468]MDF1607828.1 hypothetical protein [Hoeflea sp. YIM 152468]
MRQDGAAIAAFRRLSHMVLGCQLKNVVGISARTNVTGPGKVARSEGKVKRVVDHRLRS